MMRDHGKQRGLLSAGAPPEQDPAASIDAEVKSANMILDKVPILFIKILLKRSDELMSFCGTAIAPLSVFTCASDCANRRRNTALQQSAARQMRLFVSTRDGIRHTL